MYVLHDEELLFLCNLMQMCEENITNDFGDIVCESPFSNIWVQENCGFTISELIESIDIEALRYEPHLRMHNFAAVISGYEWADMLEGIKISKVRDLRLEKIEIDDKRAMNTYFTDEAGNGYVAFHGTSVGEWRDNFEAGFVIETEQQVRALHFVEGIEKDNLTVVGHSKGGNKAKYVALLSDKVSRCVSFDGQGFSQDFLKNYESQILKNRYKITCYALGNDFVNIFMHDIFENKLYIEGNGVMSFEENHSPNSFFKFHYNESGHVSWYEFVECEQTALLKQIHKFSNYLIENPETEDRERILITLGETTQMLLGRKPPQYEKKYSILEILRYVKNNTSNFKLLWGYFKAYEKHDMYYKPTH